MDLTGHEKTLNLLRPQQAGGVLRQVEQQKDVMTT